MPALHTNPAPRQLPFHAESFGWEHFERFCATWFVSGASLPNLDLSGNGPSRLRITDAVRYGTAGARQHGIDILATMETRATWVVQCKHIAKFSRSEAESAITKAEAEYGSQNPARYLLWVTGRVSPDALDLVQSHPNWTLWDGERLSQEFLLHTPRRQALDVIARIFGPAWAKAFFPLPDHLLITAEEFFSRWAGEGRLFHHRAVLVGRQELVERVSAFGCGGKGSKALILSAPGGIGKTRLLRAAAERMGAAAPGRIVRFTNPDASSDAEPPRHEDASLLTVIHDDAHRLYTIPRLVLSILSHKEAGGSRLILATRPGAEEALRELLMSCGYPAQSIETAKVGKLTRAAMEQLAAACLDDAPAETSRRLAGISDGCALITLVGAELLRRGEIKLDLISNNQFRDEVFVRFEGQELDRVRGSLDRPLMEKLLRSIALLSPWDNRDPSAAQVMAEFLGIQRGQVEAACDSLLAGGLLVRTHEGLRITPDLFSDHLAYAACYDNAGRITDFISKFLDRFAEQHSQTVLRNLAEAEWRALKQHGSAAHSVVAPVWRRFLDDFSRATFWERSNMLKRWAEFSVYQPGRSLELAAWAMDLTAAPAMPDAESLDRHSVVLEKIPALLKPVAIWSDEHRRASLNLLWRLRRDFQWSHRNTTDAGYGIFAEIAGFKYNYPVASNGVLDWLENLLTGPDAALAADRPSDFVQTVMGPYFVRCVEENFLKDARTFVFRNVPVSVSKTKAVRQRAFRILTEQIIPRGTVAAINALPALGDAFHQAVWLCELSPAVTRAWLPEQRRTLQAIEELAARYPHPLVHHAIRRLLHWHIVYGEHKEFTPACRKIVVALPDTFELRLARLTLSWCHDDPLESDDSNDLGERMKREEAEWAVLTEAVATQLLERYPDAAAIHAFLSQWYDTCDDHGLSPRLGALLIEIASRIPLLAFDVLDCIQQTPNSKLTSDAALLLGNIKDETKELRGNAIQRGLKSGNPDIVRSFLHAIQFQSDLRSDNVRSAVLHLAGNANGQVLAALIQQVRYPSKPSWSDEITRAILNRSINDKEADDLAEAIYHWARYSSGTLSESTVSAILNRLADSRKLQASYPLSGFLHDIAHRYPLLLFDMLLRRMTRHEQGATADDPGFEAIPYASGLSLRGIEKESDFENIARDLLKRIQNAGSEHRWKWEQLFAMTVAKTSPLLEPLLLEWLPTAKDADELSDLAGLTRFEGSLVIFNHPKLTEAILTRARAFGPEAYDRIAWKLIHSAGPQMRGYTNGELDPEQRYLREEADKAVRLYESHPVLGPFFRKVLENEMRDADWHRKEIAERDAEEW